MRGHVIIFRRRLAIYYNMGKSRGTTMYQQLCVVPRYPVRRNYYDDAYYYIPRANCHVVIRVRGKTVKIRSTATAVKGRKNERATAHCRSPQSVYIYIYI